MTQLRLVYTGMCAIFFCIPMTAFADNEATSHLQIESHESQGILPRSVWELGIYGEQLMGNTGKNYSAHAGYIASMEQQIIGHWTGSLEVRWSLWEITAMSKAAYNEKLTPWGSVFASTGIGYMRFINNLNGVWDWRRSHTETQAGETVVAVSVGVRCTLSDSWLLKFGVETWRGVNSSKYFGNIYYAEIGYGDAWHLGD